MIRLCTALCYLAFVASVFSTEPDSKKTTCEVNLIDGSRLIGVPALTNLMVQTSFAKIDIKLDSVAGITMAENAETVTLDLQNGDQLHGVVALKTFPLETIFGAVGIDMKHVTAITLFSNEATGGAVLHYSFDRDKDGKIIDQSGNHHHGTVVGNVQHVDSFKGQAIRTRNKDTYVVASASGLSPDGWRQLTVSAWVNLSAYSSYGRVINRGNAARSGAFELSVGGVYGGKPCDGRFGVDLGGDKPVRIRVRRFADLNQWHHIAGVYDGRTVKYYVDGAEIGSKDIPDELRNKPIVEAKGMDLVIGKCGTHRTWSNSHINGMMDEILIYKRALTAPQIEALYKSEKR